MSHTQQIKEITDRLEQGITGLFASDAYKDYLKTMSRFTSYSLNNTLLIAKQKPDATTVAGYSTWKKMDRHIIKGSKAIKVIAPCLYKKKAGADMTGDEGKSAMGKDGGPAGEQTEKVLMGFKIANVFDISQTEGKPLPEIAHTLDGSVDGYADFMEAIKQFSPVPVKLEPVEGPANGYYHPANKQIVIDESLSQIMHCKTGIHELAHALLHNCSTGAGNAGIPDRETREVEAESIAYTVCQYFGLDSSDYSFGYIAGWSSGKDLKELKSSLDTIRQTAGRIIAGIERELDGIQQSRRISYENIQKGGDVREKSGPVHNRALRH